MTVDDIRDSFNAIAAPVMTEKQPAHAKNKPYTCNADFTTINWFGEKYQFALGMQSSVVKVLIEELESSGSGLHQSTIGNRVDSSRESFRVDAVFRGHPAYRAMIVPLGDGKYGLAVPEGKKRPAKAQNKQKTPK